MKKIISILAFTSLLCCSCDYLDVVPEGKATEEDIWKTTLGEAVEHYKVNDPRGEYVLVMAGAPDSADPEQELTLEQAAHRALELTGQGFGPTAAAKAAAQGTPYSKSEVYKQLLVLQQGQQAGE